MMHMYVRMQNETKGRLEGKISTLSKFLGVGENWRIKQHSATYMLLLITIPLFIKQEKKMPNKSSELFNFPHEMYTHIQRWEQTCMNYLIPLILASHQLTHSPLNFFKKNNHLFLLSIIRLKIYSTQNSDLYFIDTLMNPLCSVFHLVAI